MEFTAENRNKLIESNNCYMVGMLSENESFYPTTGDTQEVITTLKNSSSLLFYIKSLSFDPQPINELIDPTLGNPVYIGIDTDQNNLINTMSYTIIQDIEEKKKELYEKLRGKLILFKPKITFRDDKVYKNLSIVNIETEIKSDKSMEFIAVPTMDIKNSEFEKKLLDGSNLLLEDFNQVMYPPEYIICNNYLYFNFPEWTKHPSNHNVWICEKYAEKIDRIKININSSESEDKIIRGTDNIIFIDKQLLLKLEINGEKEKITVSLEDDISICNNEQDTSYINNVDKIISKEYSFIKAFKDYTLNHNLCYSFEDLINLHICIKTNPLTILAGMSGTGKSELANDYAKMLKASEEQGTLLFLPISPSYTEPGDILGFLNNTTGLFSPSETRLADFLIHAKNNPNSMHVVIFDEMNLSQVEYWFAPFISLLEKKEGERILYLYSPNAHCINNQSYPPSILIEDNVKFIGTVNIDETTKDFSDRLLDRANVINLRKEKLSTLKSSLSEQNPNKLYENFQCESYKIYKEWIVDEKWDKAYSDEEVNFLDELHDLMNKFDVQKGVSFRIAKKIAEFLLNIPVDLKENSMLSRKVAFDLQIKQRIITKIKGTEKQYGSLIGIIKDNSISEPIGSELYNFFNSEKAKIISDFTLTKQEIARKAKELGIYGYAN